MRKALLAAGLAALMAMPVMAEDVATLAEKIDRVDEVPGLILACGFTGHGFGTAPAVGLMLSQIVAGEDTIVDISSLSYDRFKSLK